MRAGEGKAPLADESVRTALAPHATALLGVAVESLGEEAAEEAGALRAIGGQTVCLLLAALLAAAADAAPPPAGVRLSGAEPLPPLVVEAIGRLGHVLRAESADEGAGGARGAGGVRSMDAVAREVGRLGVACGASADGAALRQQLVATVAAPLVDALSSAAPPPLAVQLARRLAALCVDASWSAQLAALVALCREATHRALRESHAHADASEAHDDDVRRSTGLAAAVGAAVGASEGVAQRALAELTLAELQPGLLPALRDAALAAAKHSTRSEPHRAALIARLVAGLVPLWVALCASGGSVAAALLQQSAQLLAPLRSPGGAAGEGAAFLLAPLLEACLAHCPRALELPPDVLPALRAAPARSSPKALAAERAVGAATVGAADASDALDLALDTALLRCLCAATNKWSVAADLDAELQRMREAAAAGDAAALRRWIWTAKAAAARGGKYVAAVAEPLVALIAAPPAGAAAAGAAAAAAWCRTAADGVGLVLAPSPALLVRESGAQLAPLLAQRLFSAVFPRLLEAYERAPPASAERGALLRACVRAISHAPAAPMRTHAAAALPLLSQWLQAAADEPLADGAALQLLLSALAVARALLVALPAEQSGTVAALLPSWLKLLPTLDAPGGAAAKERLVALERCLDCIAEVRALPYHAIFPHKRTVLLALKKPLDHHKRQVRQAASRCANQWHLLKPQR